MEISASLRKVLRAAQRIAVLTGAGVSAESGIETFRDENGLWKNFSPEELATPGAFRRDPATVQSWYAARTQKALEVDPNPAHVALAALEQDATAFTLVTQNVDNLHQRGGSKNVIEIHGNITRTRCVDCGDRSHRLDTATTFPVACGSCGGMVRPEVVWFGESLPVGAFELAASAARSCELFLSIGTSSVVFPAADLPIIALEAGAYTVEINVRRSAIAAELHEVLLGPAGRVVPQLVAERLRDKREPRPH